MATTTIRLDDEMKERIAAAAERAGKSSHAFMLDAIAESVTRDEEDRAFYELADQRWAQFQADGLAVPWDEVRPWLEARARGDNPPWPKARRITK